MPLCLRLLWSTALSTAFLTTIEKRREEKTHTKNGQLPLNAAALSLSLSISVETVAIKLCKPVINRHMGGNKLGCVAWCGLRRRNEPQKCFFTFWKTHFLGFLCIAGTRSKCTDTKISLKKCKLSAVHRVIFFWIHFVTRSGFGLD